jgi:hypothetical protein
VLHVGHSSTELIRTLVEIQRRFIIDSEPARAFRDLLVLFVEFSGSEGGFLGKVSYRDGGQRSLTSLAAVNLPDGDGLDGTGLNSEFFDSPCLDWSRLCDEMDRSGFTTFFVPSGSAEMPPAPWWGLPCYSDDGVLVGVVGLTNSPEDYDDELLTTLRSLCDLYGVMLDADRVEQQKGSWRDRQARPATVVSRIIPPMGCSSTTARAAWWT